MSKTLEPYQQLEHDFGKEFNLDPDCLVSCSSGTAALHLAVEAFQFDERAEIMVPDFTMIACARAVTLAELFPIFVDCEANRLTLDPTQLALNRTRFTRAIMPVHIYGRRCDMDAISHFALESGLIVIEDMAEAHGVHVHPKSHAACWSFYKNKIVAGEEGGMVWFHQAYLAQYAKQLRSLGFTEAHDFLHIPRGMNYRMSNLHATAVLESLRCYKHNARARREVERRYDEVLDDYQGIIPKQWLMPHRDACWVYDLRIPGGYGSLVAFLNEKGIAARHGFKPMSTQPEYFEAREHRHNRRALLASREVFYLPIRPEMNEADVEEIIAHIAVAANA